MVASIVGQLRSIRPMLAFDTRDEADQRLDGDVRALRLGLTYRS